MSESLVVGSKVKAYLKSKGKKCAGDLMDQLNAEIARLLDRAVHRADANNRAAVRSQDL